MFTSSPPTSTISDGTNGVLLATAGLDDRAPRKAISTTVNPAAVTDDVTSPERPAAPFPKPAKTDKPRPHTCTTCLRAFARLEHLKRHERSHTKEKPFECPECSRCFARRDLLLRHQQKLHQSTTPASRPRNRPESTGSGITAPSRIRKNSVVSANAVAANTAAVNAMARPRANTISHTDASTMHMIANAQANVAMSQVSQDIHGHSRHHSLAGFPTHHAGHNVSVSGMSSVMGHRGLGYSDLPKLETHGINSSGWGLHTAPSMNICSTEIDWDNFVMDSQQTINPNALHYADSPHSMAMSPYYRDWPDLPANQYHEETFEWIPGFDQGMSFNNAGDGSSPSAMSTNSLSGVSDVMLDGSNHPAGTMAPNSMWPQPAVMAPPQMQTSFSMDMTGSVFSDLMNVAPISPHAASQKNINDMSFPTPPSSMSSESPSAMPTMGTQVVDGTLSIGAGPETPTSMNGLRYEGDPVTSITEATLTVMMNSLSQGASSASRRYSNSPLSPHHLATTENSPEHGRYLPRTQDLQRYVSAYLCHFQPHLPFVHVPTLSFDVSSPSAPSRNGSLGRGCCLLLSMAAIGALYEREQTESRELFDMAKKMMQVYLDEQADVRKAELRRNTMQDACGGPAREAGKHTPVWLVQAMLLNVIYGHYCGDKTASDVAATHVAALCSLAKDAGLHSPARSDGSDGDDLLMTDVGSWAGVRDESVEQVEWLRWKTMEERKRTLYAIFVLSSFLLISYHHTPSITNAEVLLDLPCDEDYFAADSAVAFHAMGGIRAASRNRVMFHDAVAALLRPMDQQQRACQGADASDLANGIRAGLRPSAFGCLVLINALHNYIWETRESHHNKVWTNEETENMHRQIEPALKAWQAAWASNPHHSPERPNPFGIGPLSADAIPLLDLAYVRLFVNLSRCKEKFWQRDWDGLVEELARGTEAMQHAGHSPCSNSDSWTDVSELFTTSPVLVDSPGTPSSSTGFFTAVSLPPNMSTPQSQGSMCGKDESRSEKHLRKAAFYAADSLSVSGLGLYLAESGSKELPLQSAVCTFDCAQVLAEWVATLQDRVGKYVGILGQENLEMNSLSATLYLDEEDLQLLGKIREVCTDAEASLGLNLVSDAPANETEPRLQQDGHTGYAARLLRLTAYILDKVAVWEVCHLMARCLELHANHMRVRAERSTVHNGSS